MDTKLSFSARIAKRSLLLILVYVFFCAGGCSKGQPSEKARLLLLITVDQLSYEYIERFAPLFTGGFATLLEKGAVFTNAHYTHADTSTCPGHATLVSGVHPSRSGIISNGWYDRFQKRGVYCVEDDRYGRSPRNLRVPALSDWVENHSWYGKVYSAGGKDRSAVMLGGQNASAAFWYQKSSGRMVSSGYYGSADEVWVSAFNRKDRLRKYFGTSWVPEELAEGSAKAAEIVQLDQGDFPNQFPHQIGSPSLAPDRSFYGGIYGTPYLDEHIAEFAKALIEGEEVGKDSSLDFLGLSFSALDTVGHRYGPNSFEVLDVMLKLDKTLGDLFLFLDREIGLEHIVIALSSDHGVQPMPEFTRRRGQEGHRQSAEDVACIQQAGESISRQFDIPDLFLANLYLNREQLAFQGIDPVAVETELKKELEKCPMIERVWTYRELESSPESPSKVLQMFQRSYDQKRSGDFFVQLKKYHLNKAREGSQHGSPYQYDTHIPILVSGPGVKPGRISDSVDAVDLAPTLAGLLSVEIPEGLDGKDRSNLLFD